MESAEISVIFGADESTPPDRHIFQNPRKCVCVCVPAKPWRGGSALSIFVVLDGMCLLLSWRAEWSGIAKQMRSILCADH